MAKNKTAAPKSGANIVSESVARGRKHEVTLEYLGSPKGELTRLDPKTGVVLLNEGVRLSGEKGALATIAVAGPGGLNLSIDDLERVGWDPKSAGTLADAAYFATFMGLAKYIVGGKDAEPPTGKALRSFAPRLKAEMIRDGAIENTKQVVSSAETHESAGRTGEACRELLGAFPEKSRTDIIGFAQAKALKAEAGEGKKQAIKLAATAAIKAHNPTVWETPMSAEERFERAKTQAHLTGYFGEPEAEAEEPGLESDDVIGAEVTKSLDSVSASKV